MIHSDEVYLGKDSSSLQYRSEVVEVGDWIPVRYCDTVEGMEVTTL